MKKKLYVIAGVVGLGISVLGYGVFNTEEERPVENTAYTVVSEYKSVSGCFETPFK